MASGSSAERPFRPLSTHRWACGGGHLEVARWLLEEVGAPVDHQNKDRRTALQWACKSGRCEVARYMLDSGGADPTLRMKVIPS